MVDGSNHAAPWLKLSNQLVQNFFHPLYVLKMGDTPLGFPEWVLDTLSISCPFLDLATIISTILAIASQYIIYHYIPLHDLFPWMDEWLDGWMDG